MDERLALIEQEKQNALKESNNVYNQMLQNNQNLYNQQNAYVNTYEKTQNDVLDKQLAHQQELVNQQKENARQNMETESKKAKNDYTAYNNPYGYRAESMANRGLLNSGVSETAKLGSFNTYQNRLATANKVMQDAFLQYDNDMNEARLNNDVQKAQNALNKLQMQLQYTDSFYNNQNNLTQNQLSTSQALNSEYYNRYQNEYANIQAEKQRQEQIRQWEMELAEQQKQYNEQFAYKKEQDALTQANWEKQLAYQQEQDRLAQSNWEREYALSKQTTDYNTNGGNNVVLEDNTELSLSNNQINTPYYQGAINPDTQYGTFNTKDSNGIKYQPNNVGGNKLSKTGKTVSEMLNVIGNTGSTGINIDNQNVWTTNGKYYVWDGSLNKYVDITEQIWSNMASTMSETSANSKYSKKVYNK